MDCRACEGISSDKGFSKFPKLFETEKIIGYAISNHAASKGHCLVLPKTHYEQMHEILDDTRREIIIALKRPALILGEDNYNILQNNGALSFQTLFHAHFHLIPKHSSKDGLRYLRDEGTFSDIDQKEVVELILQRWKNDI